MKLLDKNQVGLIIGIFLGGLHLLWVILVAFGLAQIFMDWIYSLHFLNNPFTVGVFDVSKAVVLVVLTFTVGYILGWAFIAIWNMMIKKK